MLDGLGIRNRLDLLLLVSLIVLVAITPLGNEGTQPLVFAAYRTLLFVILIACCLPLRRIQDVPISPGFLLSAAALVMVMLVSVLVRPVSHFEGLYTFYRDLLFLMAFLTLAQRHRWLSTSLKQAVLASVVAIDLVYVTASVAAGARPFRATFSNPNYFASFLLVGFAVAVAATSSEGSQKLRAWGAISALILWYGISQTWSRGATLAALAVLGAAMARMPRPLRASRIMPLAAFAILILAAMFGHSALREKFTDRGQRDPYNYQRTAVWIGALKMIADNPFLGVGLGQYRYVSKLYTPPMEGGLARFGRWPNIAHSEYLHYAAEIGLPAALLMFALAAYLLLLAWRRAGSRPREEQWIQEAALYAAAGAGFHALVDNNFTVPVLAAAMAVISPADLLPYRSRPVSLQWTSGRVGAVALVILGVYVHSTVIPATAFQIYQMASRAYWQGDFARAERLFHAVQLVSDDQALFDELGGLYLDRFKKTGQAQYLDMAESFFRKSLQANPDFEAAGLHLEAALFQRLTGDSDKDRPIHLQVIETDRHVLHTNPYNPFTRKNLAEALYYTGNRRQAIEELLKAIQIEPNFVPAYLRLAEWLQEQGQVDQSEQYRQKALQIAGLYEGKATDDPFEALLLGRPLRN
jgi:O-antigen ligase